MTEQRDVWIIGEPEEGRSHAYHHGTCYVLDQISNRDRARKIRLSQVPTSYTPCEICAPGGRTAGRETATHLRSGRVAELSVRVVESGDRIDIEDLEKGSTSTYRIVEPGRPLGAGVISSRSPLAAAVLQRQEGEVVEFTPPSGKSRKVRIARIWDVRRQQSPRHSTAARDPQQLGRSDRAAGGGEPPVYGDTSSIQTFGKGDDTAYEAWVQKHGGYVLTERSPKEEGYMLHTADCTHLGLTTGRWSLTGRPRRCSTMRRPLVDWAERESGTKPVLCQSCM